MTLRIERVTGSAVRPHIPAVAALRIRVFREFPYLYDGDLGYEENYLRTYSASPESLFVLVFDDEEVVGASTGVPMSDETDEFKRPFLAHGYDPETIFYFGESVLLPAYRGRGIGVRFFPEREAYARSLGRFRYTAFCAVDRPADHPRRPPDHEPLDRFWEKRGYRRHPELTTTYSWKEIDEPEQSHKPMTFWMRELNPA